MGINAFSVIKAVLLGVAGGQLVGTRHNECLSRLASAQTPVDLFNNLDDLGQVLGALAKRNPRLKEALDARFTTQKPATGPNQVPAGGGNQAVRHNGPALIEDDGRGAQGDQP